LYIHQALANTNMTPGYVYTIISPYSTQSMTSFPYN
jgi:hypothetical protein